MYCFQLLNHATIIAAIENQHILFNNNCFNKKMNGQLLGRRMGRAGRERMNRRRGYLGLKRRRGNERRKGEQGRHLWPGTRQMPTRHRDIRKRRYTERRKVENPDTK